MNRLKLRYLGAQEYLGCWQAMRDFTAQRTVNTPDEIWLLEHPAVYSLGLNGDPQHLLRPDDTPLIQTDRGGQITWHGPGQLIAYVLLDLHRLNIGIRQLVSSLEQAVILTLQSLGIQGHIRPGAPGVYVDGQKIASVGLRICRGRSYHGLSLNIDNDIAPFSRINTCGYPGLSVTTLACLGINATAVEMAPALSLAILDALAYRVSDIIHTDS